MFKKEDIKPGMAVVLRRGMKCVLIPCSNGEIVAVDFSHASYPAGKIVYKENGNINPLAPVCEGKESPFDVMRVYSEASICQKVLDIPNSRELLWEREPYIKEVTIAEVEKMFGCKVKIVKEEN